MISFHTCPAQAPGEGKVGGMNVYVRELSKYLGGMGIDVDIFTRCHSNECLDRNISGENVRIIHVDGGANDTELEDLYTHVDSFADGVRRFQENEGHVYRLIHSHYWLSGMVGAILSQKTDTCHVITFHTLAELKKRALSGEGELSLRSLTERNLMQSADQIIAFSHHEMDAMVEMYGASRDRVKAVHCGVDLSQFKPLDMHESRKRLGLNGGNIMLYVGRIEPLKGVEFLLLVTSMMDMGNSLKVLIVGGDPDQEKELKRLMTLSKKIGVSEVVDFVGRVNQDELPSYFSAADVCFVPSYYESFGLVALEAMACGTPVVASRVGGLPGIIKHGRNGYLLPWRCPERYADTLTMVLLNKNLRDSMSKAAVESAGTMGWGMVSKKFIDIYQTMLKEKIT